MLAVLNALEPIATRRSANRYSELAQGLSSGADALAAFLMATKA